MWAAGHGPDILERYTWEQIEMMAKGVGAHHARMFRTLFAPVAAALGGKYTGGKPKRGRKRRTRIDYEDPAAVERARQRDSRILLGASGIKGIKVEL